VCAPIAGAAGGYGPFSPPTASGGAAGFEATTAAAKTFGRAGGRLTAKLAHSDTVTIDVPAGAFTTSRQIAILAPSTSQLKAILKGLHRPGYAAVTGLGIQIAPGGLTKPLSVVITGPGVGTATGLLLRLTSPKASTRLGATTGRRRLSFPLSTSASLLVIDKT
jgi:hypothetical protein